MTHEETKRMLMEQAKNGGMLVGNNWRVRSDNLNIILEQQQINKANGEKYWQVHGYYSSVASTLLELVEQGVRDTQLKDLKTVCDKIEQLRQDILHSMTKDKRVEEQAHNDTVQV